MSAPFSAAASSAAAPGGRTLGPGAGELTLEDRNVLANVDRCLADGIALFDWWRRAEASGEIADQFELSQVFNRPDEGYAFFAEAELPSGPLPVMGDVPLVFYDQPKADKDLERWTREVQVYALRYFMRIADFRQPEVVIDDETPGAGGLLRYLSWCPRGYVRRGGFGFEQLYFKRRGSGQIGKFSAEERFAIVDVRELQTRYEWVVGNVRIFNFDLSFPLDPDLPRLSLPLPEAQYVIFHETFVRDELEPPGGFRGRFNFGYAMLKPLHDHSVLAYGPGQFDAGFQLFDFRVRHDGTIRVQMPFVVNRPAKILDVSLNPLDWAFRAAEIATLGRSSQLLEPLHFAADRLPFRPGGIDPVSISIDLVNLFTFGQAARRLCISKESLERFFLIFHFNQYYTMITGSLLTWRQIRDWLDRRNLPEWVKTGRSS